MKFAPPKPPATAYEAFLDTLRMEFARRRITQRDVAEVLGATEIKISRRMNGLTEWTARELIELQCAGLDVVGLLQQAAEVVPPTPRHEGDQEVAGAGFEPATSGLRADADLLGVAA